VGSYGLDASKDRDQWLAVMNAVNDISGPIKSLEFLD
jgi:hypothetical protein